MPIDNLTIFFDMKKVFLFVVAIMLSFFSFGQSKKDILAEIFSYKKTLSNTASYDVEKSKVWNAMMIIVGEEYNEILKESESRGYIEAYAETESQREWMTVELLGDVAPYQVSFRVKTEHRTKQPDGTFTPWKSSYYDPTAYYTKLRIRLYEIINGPIELPKELEDKIEKYNSLQDKDRKKIYKGKDY